MMEPCTERRVAGAWRFVPTALALALALIELSSVGGLFFSDTTAFLTHTVASHRSIRFNTFNPAYPLLLDLLCFLFPAAARMGVLVVLQQAAVVAISWFVLRCGEMLGRPRAGWTAALLTALYAPLSFFAQTAQTDSLFAFLFVATSCSFCRAAVTNRARWWIVAGALAAGAMAQRSSGVALVAAGVVALAFTRPRAHARALAFFAAGFVALLGLVLLKNRLDYGGFTLVQGRGIHLFCRVAVVDQNFPDSPEVRRLLALARANGHDSLCFDQAGWHLHRMLVEQEHLTPEAADALLDEAALQALRADLGRTARLTWQSMCAAVARDDATSYALGRALRPLDFIRFDAEIARYWQLTPDLYAAMRSLLPPYAPRAAADDWRYALLERWSRVARIWCGTWLLFALLVVGAFGLARQDAVLVFLTGAPFAQIAASALGDKPWVGHLDPAAPLVLLAFALAAARFLDRFASRGPPALV